MSAMRVALMLSVGAHASALGLGLALLPERQPHFSVEQAPMSMELLLLAPRTPVEPSAELPPVREDAPAPQLEASVAEPEPETEPERVEDEAAWSDPSQGSPSPAEPRAVRNPTPRYPRLARERGHEGRVLLAIEVLPSGLCGDVRIESSSGHALLDRAAVEGIRRWRFEPAQRFGQPVRAWVEIPVEFQLLSP